MNQEQVVTECARLANDIPANFRITQVEGDRRANFVTTYFFLYRLIESQWLLVCSDRQLLGLLRKWGTMCR